LDEVKEVIFQVDELIITLQYLLKCDFGEIDEAMFQGVERQCELIFCILGIQKSVWDEVV
jgi:hypothetical protein